MTVPSPVTTRTRGQPRLYVEVYGDGEPLLCLTGFALSGAVFEPVVGRYVDAGYQPILFDPRGVGRTAGGGALTSIPELAHDGVRVLDQLGIEAAHVYGVSFGGMVAQELALRFPDRVRGLVLGGTTPGGPRARLPNLGRLARLGRDLLRSSVAAGRPTLAPLLFSDRFRREHPDRVVAVLRSFRAHRSSWWGVNAHWWASVYHDTYQRLPDLAAPTLVMHGGADRLVPLRNAEVLAERIPDAELAVVDGTGHAYLLEAPDRALELFDEWRRSRAPIPPGDPLTVWERSQEVASRPFGLQVGALRTGRSLLAAGVDRVLGGRSRAD